MKKVSIAYIGKSLTRNAFGNSADEAYRKVKDDNGFPVHTAKGRLTQLQFVQRCNCNGIRVDSIHVKGNKIYDHHRDNPIKIKGVTDKWPQQKFLLARFSTRCNETGFNILKNDPIFHNKTTREIFCTGSNTFKQALIDKKPGWNIINNNHLETTS